MDMRHGCDFSSYSLQCLNICFFSNVPARMNLYQVLILGCNLALFASAHPSFLPNYDFRQQKLLNNIKHKESYQKGAFTLLAQNDTLCNTGHHGKQWSGTIDVTDNKRLFFCELQPPVF